MSKTDEPDEKKPLIHKGFFNSGGRRGQQLTLETRMDTRYHVFAPAFWMQNWMQKQMLIISRRQHANERAALKFLHHFNFILISKNQ